MFDSITHSAAEIAKLAFTEFIKGSAGVVGKGLTEAAIPKINKLREEIWQKLSNKQSVERLKTPIEQSKDITLEQLGKITSYLEVALDEDPNFAQRIKFLVQEIYVERRESINQNNDGQQNIGNSGNGNVYNNARDVGDTATSGGVIDKRTFTSSSSQSSPHASRR